MAEQDLTRPALRYSSAGRRPERLNQSRDVNAPLQLARGWAAGLLGLPGDFEGLVRMLPGIRDETPVLPTSDFYREALPGYDERPAARAMSGLGALTGGAGATGVVRGGLGAVKRAADPEAIRQYVRATQGLTGMPGTAVVKPKGGNWLAGADSPENAVRVLKRSQAYVGMPPAELEAANASDAALNTWIDQKLAKYIRNEMATPEDPVRALAERGVLHTTPEHVFLPSDTAFQRQAAGYPRHGMAESQLATDWETLADATIASQRAGDIARRGGVFLTDKAVMRENPWIAKLLPETPVYSMTDPRAVRTENLGFGHLIDELRNAITPSSGLPRELQLKPEQLSKVTMPQAVELVDRINKWRAAQKAEADLARSTNIATFEHKAYPEQGYRWVELRLPEESTPLPEGYSLSTVTNERLPPGHMGRNSYAVVDPQGRMLEGTGTAYTEADAMGKFKRAYYGKALEDALKYEGEVMGHCVGGYCPDVMEGRSRIFSLRDAKGQPHVTVEVKPEDWFTAMTNRSVNDSKLFNSELKRRYAEAGISPKSMKQEATKLGNELYAEMFGSPPPAEIVQIKGKANKAPKADYLPYVQDFVRSGQWGRVGDVQNTGLVDLRRYDDALQRAARERYGPSLYLTNEEMDALMKSEREAGMAAGGLVSATQYDPARIDALVNEIMASAA